MTPLWKTEMEAPGTTFSSVMLSNREFWAMGMGRLQFKDQREVCIYINILSPSAQIKLCQAPFWLHFFMLLLMLVALRSMRPYDTIYF